MAGSTRTEVRMINEKRADQTDRNRRNRAAKKERSTYKAPYPGPGKAAWPAKDRGRR